MNFLKRKKAFSTTEMIVCCLAVGLLVSAIGVFTTNISNYIINLKEKETEILDEYSDVKYLAANAVSQSAINSILLSDSLVNEQFLVEATPISQGATKTVSTTLRNSGSYIVKWTSDNTTVATITDAGVVTAIQPGNTFVTATEYEIGESGAVTKTGNSQSFPICVSTIDVYGDSTNLKCYTYIGEHYQFWKYIDIGA